MLAGEVRCVVRLLVAGGVSFEAGQLHTCLFVTLFGEGPFGLFGGGAPVAAGVLDGEADGAVAVRVACRGRASPSSRGHGQSRRATVELSGACVD